MAGLAVSVMVCPLSIVGDVGVGEPATKGMKGPAAFRCPDGVFGPLRGTRALPCPPVPGEESAVVAVFPVGLEIPAFDSAVLDPET